MTIMTNTTTESYQQYNEFGCSKFITSELIHGSQIAKQLLDDAATAEPIHLE